MASLNVVVQNKSVSCSHVQYFWSHACNSSKDHNFKLWYSKWITVIDGITAIYGITVIDGKPCRLVPIVYISSQVLKLVQFSSIKCWSLNISGLKDCIKGQFPTRFTHIGEYFNDLWEFRFCIESQIVEGCTN